MISSASHQATNPMSDHCTVSSDLSFPLLQVQLADDELGIASRKAAARLQRALRTKRALLINIASGVAFGMAAVLAFKAGEENPEWWIYGPLVAVLILLGAWSLPAMLARRRALAMLAASQSSGFSISLGPAGLIQDNGRSRFIHRWTSLEGLEISPGGICLHFIGYQSLWIPDRAFADDEIRRGFIGEIERFSGLPATSSGTLHHASSTIAVDRGFFWRDLATNLVAGPMLLVCHSGGVRRVRATVGQFLALIGLSLGLGLVSDLIQVGRAGTINWSALPQLLYGVPWLLLAPWAASLGDKERSPLAGAVALAALWLPVEIALLAWGSVIQSTSSPAWLQAHGTGYFIWLVILAWAMIASMATLVRMLGLPQEERMAAILAVIGLLLLPNLVPREEDHLWVATPSQDEQETSKRRAEYERRILPARENVLYAQSRLLDESLASIRPGRPGQPELFLLVVGGNGSQDVFRREVEAVRQLFDTRFGTSGHSLVLVNNPETVLQQPMATVTALEKSLNAMARKMNRDEDVLMLFMTSHGAQDHRFDLSLWPYRFDELTPARLRSLLDEANIRYRVVVVSACYSGGFVPPLTEEDTLVISASRADRNSHGCSHEAEWTFFGKAFFNEALRETVSLESAFSLASHKVAERERSEALTPSEPQMAMGAGIRRALGRLEKEWPSL